jgi:hypothetical protein
VCQLKKRKKFLALRNRIKHVAYKLQQIPAEYTTVNKAWITSDMSQEHMIETMRLEETRHAIYL